MTKERDRTYNQANALTSITLATPLGPMLAIADTNFLYLLEFTDRPGLAREIEHLNHRLSLEIIPGHTCVTEQIEQELNDYFQQGHYEFKTPYLLMGSDFETKVWQALASIPFGQTRSYSDLAQTIHHPAAFRAAANANGKNQLAIIIPCHRVINKNGQLGGYAGGINRKQWLIHHEKKLSPPHAHSKMLCISNQPHLC